MYTNWNSCLSAFTSELFQCIPLKNSLNSEEHTFRLQQSN